jgi:hypothetical protein
VFFKTLEVAIGVVFLYLLLTFVASAILEGIAILFNWRAKMLYRTIDVMFHGDPLVSARQIYENPLVRALGRNAAKVARLNAVERLGWHEPHTKIAPSYIPPGIFSAAVLETLMLSGKGSVSQEELSPEGFIKALRHRAAAETGAHALMSILRITLATQGASIQAVKLALEKWFNDSMDRASGWYKRRTQVWLLGLGLAIAVAGHVDTIAISQWLWSGDSARQAAMAAAQSYAGRNNAAPAGMPTAAGLQQYFGDVANQIGDLDSRISDLQYPIGWHDARTQKVREVSWQFVFGALITAIAISMGSTFWFDALQSLIKLRGSGPKPAGR